MYVKYGSETDGTQSKSTTLYIKGSAEFADGSGIIQNGRTELTGDFINGKDPGVQGMVLMLAVSMRICLKTPIQAAV
jgi:hypothetical protein